MKPVFAGFFLSRILFVFFKNKILDKIKILARGRQCESNEYLHDGPQKHLSKFCRKGVVFYRISVRLRQCESEECKSQGFSARMPKIVLNFVGLLPRRRHFECNSDGCQAISAGAGQIMANRGSLRNPAAVGVKLR